MTAVLAQDENLQELYTYMEVHDDGPDQPQDDGGFAVHDVRNIYVHQFDLEGQKSKPSTFL